MEQASHNPDRGYSLSMRVLHWVTAVILITMIAAGIYMVHGPWDGKFPPSRGMLYDYHRSMGFVLMILIIIRLVAYRFTTPPSPLPPSISPLQKSVAHSVHFLLYATLLIQPVFGWYATNVWGVKNIPIFGLFDLPPIAEKNRELGDQLLAIHGYFGFAITTLVGLHILGVLHHQFVLKDTVLQRMLRT